jgi:hypothetical protein
VEGVSLNFEQASGRADVVSQTADGSSVAVNIGVSPLSEESNEVVSLVLSVEHSREEVEVGNESTLENNWDVGSVEELDRVRYLVASDLSVTESKFNTESLEINDNEEHDNSGQKTADIGGVFSVESMLDSHHLVGLGQERMEESNNCAFKFCVLVSFDGDR